HGASPRRWAPRAGAQRRPMNGPLENRRVDLRPSVVDPSRIDARESTLKGRPRSCPHLPQPLDGLKLEDTGVFVGFTDCELLERFPRTSIADGLERLHYVHPKLDVLK